MKLSARGMESRTWLFSDCYQRFTKNLDSLKSSTEDLETVQQPTTSGRSPAASEKVIFKPDCIFCDKEWRKKIKEKVFGRLKPLQCLNVTAGVQCSKLQKIKWTRRSYGGSDVLISLAVKHVFTVMSQAVSEKASSLAECKWRKRGREQVNPEESHRTASSKHTLAFFLPCNTLSLSHSR